MDLPDPEPEPVRDAAPGMQAEAIPPEDVDGLDSMARLDGLGEIVAQLDEDPDQCWAALESLAAVDVEFRVPIIAALAEHRASPGVRALLRLLGCSRDPAVLTAARLALPEDEVPSIEDGADGATEGLPGWIASLPVAESLPALPIERGPVDLADATRRPIGRIARSLVTAVDGEGQGTIVISVRDGSHRRTAAFRCDVRLGILDVVGEVEVEHPSAGCLVDEWLGGADGDYAEDVPELAVGLLGGSLGLSGPTLPARVRAWLDGLLGPGGLPAGLPVIVTGPEDAIPDDEWPARANLVLDACPNWMDRSALTFELAEEITLREGRSSPDPVRDAGAYRYLFEHTLSRRLELYARMLLWMAWVWQASGRSDLARSAFAMAGQLADEQYAVPSHPFTVALTTRSLREAQALSLSGDAPEPGA